MNKGYQTPWQIISELDSNLDLALARVAAVMLDYLAPDHLV